MTLSKILSSFPLPGPGPYDLASSEAEVAGYYALRKKVLADEESRRKQAEAKKRLHEETGGPQGSRKVWRSVRAQ
jgi:hypothetical protein